MEIRKYLDEYRKYDPEDFYNRISRGRIMEIRFLSDRYGNKFRDYDLIKIFGLPSRFSSIYINSYEQLKRILLYRIDGIRITKLYNIFIGVNPRRQAYTKTKSGILRKTFYGGIAGTSHIQNILFDIEHIFRGMKKQELINWHKQNELPFNKESIDRYLSPNASEFELEECIQGAYHLIELYGYTDYYLNISGNGVHLWILLNEEIELPMPEFEELDDKVKYKLKEEPIFSYIKKYNRYIEIANSALQKFNIKLKVDDGAKDLSRIARPPGSFNVKVGRIPRMVGTVKYNNKLNNNIKQKFMAVNLNSIKPKQTHINNNRYVYNISSIKDSPLVKLLLNKQLPSILSRNHYLEQSLARLIRDNKINLSQIQDLINAINKVQGKEIQIDPEYLDGDEPFNPEAVNAYCFGCRLDFVYPILDGIPPVKERLDVDNINKISFETIEKVKIDIKQPKNYIELKELIRNLIDNDVSRSIIYYSFKYIYKSEWEYFSKNKIIETIIDKTRKQTK